MTVHIRGKQFGAPPTTQFTDTMLGQTTSYGLGDDWVSGGPLGFNIEGAGSQVARNTLNGGIWSASAALQNNVYPVQFMMPVSLVSTVRSSQYAEMEFDLNNSAQGVGVIVAGLFMLAAIEGSQYRGYAITQGVPDATPTNDFWQVHRFNNAAFTALGNGANGSLIPGDVLGCSVEVASGQNNLRIFVNNTLVSSITDNGGTRPTFGNLGIGRTVWVSNVAPGTRNVQYKSFFARSGTR